VAQYNQEKAALGAVVASVDRNSRSFRPKVYFEEVANKGGVTIEALQADDAVIPEDNPLAEEFSNVNIEFRLPKVSIPRMLKFLGEVEKSDQTLFLSNLVIRGRYGDKLYFDTQAKVTGLKVKGD
jgi:hypothetical protein